MLSCSAPPSKHGWVNGVTALSPSSPCPSPHAPPVGFSFQPWWLRLMLLMHATFTLCGFRSDSGSFAKVLLFSQIGNATRDVCRRNTALIKSSKLHSQWAPEVASVVLWGVCLPQGRSNPRLKSEPINVLRALPFKVCFLP